MILNPDSHPQRQLYYLGAKALEVLQSNNGLGDFFYIYQKLQESEDISIKLFVLTLDWLYLLGAIDSTEGNIKQCS
ncbi:hypothetical protein AAOGI_38140 [Agarivorans albus]